MLVMCSAVLLEIAWSVKFVMATVFVLACVPARRGEQLRRGCDRHGATPSSGLPCYYSDGWRSYGETRGRNSWLGTAEFRWRWQGQAPVVLDAHDRL